MRFRFKLDQNLSPVLANDLRQAGHDAATVEDEGLGGASDNVVAEAALAERRCLLTGDNDFARILDFPPHLYAGIVVLRHPRVNLARLRALVRQLAEALATDDPVGRLWIVEPGRIRVHEPTGDL